MTRPFIVTTIADLAHSAAERWHRQYSDAGRWRYGDDKRRVYEQLAALDSPTPAKVAEAIGNDWWTRLKCDHCERSVDAAVSVGQEPDCESRTASLCLTCAEGALAALRGDP